MDAQAYLELIALTRAVAELIGFLGREVAVALNDGRITDAQAAEIMRRAGLSDAAFDAALAQARERLGLPPVGGK